MRQYEIRNQETGELKVLNNGESFSYPWAFVQAIPQINVKAAALAVWAEDLGIPLPTLLGAANWLLDRDCKFCQLAHRVLEQLDRLGKERAKELITLILDAKGRNDRAALEEIRKSLWSSESPELPPRS